VRDVTNVSQRSSCFRRSWLAEPAGINGRLVSPSFRTRNDAGDLLIQRTDRAYLVRRRSFGQTYQLAAQAESKKAKMESFEQKFVDA
jgi:hypothetical protein